MTKNWTTFAEPSYPWERGALDFVRKSFPPNEPYRAWSNFEFVALDGSINEVDLLVFTPEGFFLIEIKSNPVRLTGDAGTWTFFLAYRPTTESLAQPVRELAREPKVAQPVREIGDLIPSQAVNELSLSNLPQAAAEIPWGHNILIFERLKDHGKRLWYAAKTLEHGWSRAILTVQIESNLYGREGMAVSNFAGTLPAPQSDLAQQALKDPYLFDFLTLHDEAIERDLESGLVDHIQKFLLELGAGFAFVGRQHHLTVGKDDFYIDLLFYHLKLRCFVVIDLKMRKFTPEDAGKMNFYLSAVDSQMRHPDDAPSIGLVLCKTRDRITAEYALRDIAKPIGVAEWQTKLVHSLPDSLKSSLPSIQEIEAEFELRQSSTPASLSTSAPTI